MFDDDTNRDDLIGLVSSLGDEDLEIFSKVVNETIIFDEGKWNIQQKLDWISTRLSRIQSQWHTFFNKRI